MVEMGFRDAAGRHKYVDEQRRVYIIVCRKSRPCGQAHKIQGCLPKTILGGRTLAMCTHFLPKLLHNVTFCRHSNALSDAIFIILSIVWKQRRFVFLH